MVANQSPSDNSQPAQWSLQVVASDNGCYNGYNIYCTIKVGYYQ